MGDGDEPKDLPTEGCCEAMTVSCLACSLGLTEEEYCSKYPDKFGCSSAADAKSASIASAGSTRANGNQDNAKQAGLGGNADHVEEPEPLPPTKCSPEKKGELTAEFVLASLAGYVCGAVSIWLYLKCSRKS